MKLSADLTPAEIRALPLAPAGHVFRADVADLHRIFGQWTFVVQNQFGQLCRVPFSLARIERGSND